MGEVGQTSEALGSKHLLVEGEGGEKAGEIPFVLAKLVQKL